MARDILKTVKNAFGIKEPSQEVAFGTKAESGIVITPSTEPQETPKPVEEWIWVSGYKGTDKNMQCLGYQYEMNKCFDISDERPVEMCEHGFHMCRDLYSVWIYYDVESRNRFFEVKALVRKTDDVCHRDKCVAKSIIFTRELTAEEVIKQYTQSRLPTNVYTEIFNTWTSEELDRILEIGLYKAWDEVHVSRLESLGYSKRMALHIVHVLKMYSTAYAVGTQEGLSMDMKMMAIYEEFIASRNSNQSRSSIRHA